MRSRPDRATASFSARIFSKRRERSLRVPPERSSSTRVAGISRSITTGTSFSRTVTGVEIEIGQIDRDRTGIPATFTRRRLRRRPRDNGSRLTGLAPLIIESSSAQETVETISAEDGIENDKDSLDRWARSFCAAPSIRVRRPGRRCRNSMSPTSGLAFTQATVTKAQRRHARPRPLGRKDAHQQPLRGSRGRL